MDGLDGRENDSLHIQTPIELFDAFVQANDLPETISVFNNLCATLDINPKNYKTIYTSLKNGLTTWKARSLWTKLDKRAEHKDYKGKPCAKNKVLVIGAGPCGLRVAIESALLGAQVAVLEKRDRFSRNNVLHLWPFLITDLKDLGAKKFFGQFCAGSLDHISIKRLQLILLKVALIFGVQVYPKCAFGNLIEPKTGQGWKASIDPPSHPLNKYEFDIVVGADGRRQALKFKGKEFRGKLAIGITANFVNRNSKEEAQVEEISGVAFIFNQGFFQDLKDMTGIDLENIVYYKDETHYFVMCAKKLSLLNKGVIKKDLPDAYDLLHPKNVNHEKLLTYAREAANFSTKFQLPHMDFAVNHQGKEDVAMFDFTSLFAAEYSIKMYERKGRRLLALIVGDSLLEPFWPTGSGCARGFLGCFDAAWAMRSYGLGKRPLDIIAERENSFRILAQTTPENLNKNYQNYGICPDSRYTNLSKSAVKATMVRHLYDCQDGPIDNVDGVEPMDTSVPVEPPQPEVNISIVLKWCQQHTKSYKTVSISDMSRSWKDGLGLCAIIHRFRPDLIDFNSLNPNEAEKNNQLAFQIAEEHLGIQPQVSPKEIACVDVPDQLTILSYVTQYYETFRNEKPVTKSISKQDSDKQEFKTKSPLSRLSIITRMTRKKEKRKNVSSNTTVASKKSKQGNEENTPPVTPKTPTPMDLPTVPEPAKIDETDAKPKLTAKTSNRISMLAEQVFGAKDGATTTVPNLPVMRDSGSDHCYFCNRFVYLMERMSVEGHFFHRECFKCEVCLNTLRLGAYSYLPPWETDDERGHFYCRLHYYRVINNSSVEETKKRREVADTDNTETRSQKRKRRGKALTISDPRDTIKAVHQAAALRKKSQSTGKETLPGVTSTTRPIPPTPTPTVNGEPEVDTNKNITNEKLQKPQLEKEEESKKGGRKRATSGRFRRLEARPLRRSSISSVRKSDKTVKDRGKGYKLDGDLLEDGKKSPIKVPPPSPLPLRDRDTSEERKPDKKTTKKLEKSKSAEEAIKASKEPNADVKPSGKKRPTLDKLHMLGTIERRRRQRRAMYPPLSQVFSTDEPDNERTLPIETSLKDAGMNIKVFDIDIDDDGGKGTKSSTDSTQKPPSPTTKGEISPTSVTKPPLVKKTSGGSLISSRAARIQGLMDNDIRPKKYDQEIINGQESPSQQRRSLPRLPSNEEPYTSTVESTKIIKRRGTPKPRANVHEIEREVDEGKDERELVEEGFVIVSYKDLPEPQKTGPPKPPRSFKHTYNAQETHKPQNNPTIPENKKIQNVQKRGELFSPSSEEDNLDSTRSPSFQRAGARRYKSKGKADTEEEKQKRSEQAKIRIAMKQRQSKRLRRAQQIQRELQEIEVKQAEMEKEGVYVEKALRSGNLSQNEEQQNMMKWFQIINKKNALLRYESELSIHANSIQLEDQQGRLEQEIRELLMKEGATEEDQVIIQQKTKELVDIVEQRNCLVELLDEDRKREQEEDRAFEEMIAAKGFVTSV